MIARSFTRNASTARRKPSASERFGHWRKRDERAIGAEHPIGGEHTQVWVEVGQPKVCTNRARAGLAEVWVSNQDVGFVRPGQDVKLKLVAFQFQKYGMLEGKVRQVSADATEAASANTRSDALGERYRVASGMQVAGEVHLSTRSILEYRLSPLQKAWHESGREFTQPLG